MKNCSINGPITRDGKNVKIPTRIMTPTKRIENVNPVIGKLAIPRSNFFFPAIEPISAMVGARTANLPKSIAKLKVIFQIGVFVERPANALPLFAVAEVKA